MIHLTTWRAELIKLAMIRIATNAIARRRRITAAGVTLRVFG
jgi:hypothetical protein